MPAKKKKTPQKMKRKEKKIPKMKKKKFTRK